MFPQPPIGPGLDPRIPVAIGLLIAILCLWGAFRFARRKRLVDDTPTLNTQGVFIGMVELKGSAECEAPLTAYLSEQPCVHYQWSVEEHWSRTVTETYTDSDGKTKTRTRHESGWKTVDRGGESTAFYLKDEAGVIRVQPDGADVTSSQLFSDECTPFNPIYYGKGPAMAVSDSDHRRRFSETGIPLHAELYILGHARERDDVVAAEIAKDRDAPIYLISTRSEQQVSRSFGIWKVVWAVLGLVALVGGTVIAWQGHPPDWTVFVPQVLGYACLLALGWIWMAYNSLVGLRLRVEQAWASVDVQLKRRADLIPNLVQIVGGYAQHERNLQESLALLRSQLEATPPGIAGPDHQGCAPTLRALAESYPDLKANQSFLKMQESLVDTEQRIALARGYYNDIATFYNTRLQIVPDNLLASLFSFQRRALMQAADFERAPVSVKL